MRIHVVVCEDSRIPGGSPAKHHGSAARREFDAALPSHTFSARCRRNVTVGARQLPTAEHKQPAEREKGDIVSRVMSGAFAHVVQAKDLVANDKVKQPPSHERPPY
jgi:hypothetical protein